MERRSIDFIPERERHGRLAHQGQFWFLSNFHFFTIAIGFVGPSLGLSLAYTALAGALGILIGTTFQAFAVAYLNGMLVVMLYFLVPWTAVNLVDYFCVRRGRYAILDLLTPRGVYGAWGARGLIAYAVGFLASLPFFVVPGVFTGPLAARLGGVDVGWLVGLIAAAIAYLLVSARYRLADEAAAVSASAAVLAGKT
jgi:NCS1 family nucleobase:cation symporter-1